MVSAAVCSVPSHDNFVPGDADAGIVAAIGGASQTNAGAAFRIVP